MAFTRLTIQQLRNISQATLTFHPHMNFIYGDNGSGKTSLLEALYLLALGKSFRSHLKSRIINNDAEQMILFGIYHAESHQPLKIGLEKNLQTETRLHVNSVSHHSFLELANVIPLQLLHPNSYELLLEGSKPRRQFIDWGVFHVEHSFYPLWNKVQQLLKQRNAALRHQLPSDEVLLWDIELNEIANRLDNMRMEYLSQLEPLFQQIIQQLLPDISIKLTYYRGWSRDSELIMLLKTRLNEDRSLGYTRYGPQRADIRLMYLGKPVQEILSRGQQKLLVLALKLAQATLLQQQCNKSCVYLIDDLPSELDNKKQALIIQLLSQLSGQFFITAIEKAQLTGFIDSFATFNMFHVEHGVIRAINTHQQVESVVV